MPRGGSRPGERRGGRKKGTPNKRTAERQAVLAAIKASGKDPISFFADLLRNEQAPLELRFQAAKELAPYARRDVVIDYDKSYAMRTLKEHGAHRSWTACFVVPNAPVCLAKVPRPWRGASYSRIAPLKPTASFTIRG